MKPSSPIPFVAAALSLAVLPGCGGPGPEAEADGAGAAVDFVADIKPVLEEHCIRCHNDQSIFGGLNLMNRDLAMRGGATGAAIVPGSPDESPLYLVTLLPEDQDHAMPATGPKLSEDEKELLHRWIEQGAQWPGGEEGAILPLAPDPDAV